MPKPIKVTADTTKNDSFGFRAPAWKKEALKQIAEQNGTTMSAMFDEWLDGQIRQSGIKIEIDMNQ